MTRLSYRDPFNCLSDYSSTKTQRHSVMRAFSQRMSRGMLGAWSYGVCEDQCFQPLMEDAHIVAQPTQSSILMGVFDGHNGPFVANFLKTHILSLFRSSEAYAAKNYAEALRVSLLNADEVLRVQKQDLSYTGATATLAYVNDRQLYVANLGLCKAVVSYKGRARLLTQDHLAISQSERRRIEDAGGFVCPQTRKINRVHFEFSRAVGDFALKEKTGLPLVSAEASVVSYELSVDDNFVVLGSSGLWEGRSPQEVVLWIEKNRDQTMDCAKLCADLCARLTRCSTKKDFMYLPSKVGTANMTCILLMRA